MSLPQDEITRALCRDRLEVRLVPIEYTVPEGLTPGSYVDAYCGQPKTPENPRGMTSLWCWWGRDNRLGPDFAACPYGVPGDRTAEGLVVLTVAVCVVDRDLALPVFAWKITLKREDK